MSLSKKLFLGAAPACTTDTADIFGDSSGFALYPLNYDASDVSGSHNGTISGDVEFGVAGAVNSGARFDNSSQILIPHSDAFSPVENDFSCSLWVKPLGTSDVILQKNGEYQIWCLSDGQIIFDLWRNTSLGQHARPRAYNTSIYDGDWHHIVITADYLSSYKLYLDGVKVAEDTPNLEMRNTGNQIQIGRSGLSEIDQVRFFQKALIQSEVDTLYAETACVYTSTTDNNDYPVTNTAYYKLDNNAEDAKGNYDGTAANVNYEFGRFGQAAVFNGSSSYITANKSMFGTGDGVANLWSISLWFKTDGSVTASRTLVGTKGGSTQSGFFLYMISGGQIRYYEGNTSTNSQQLTTTTSYDDGNWHNVVITRSGTTDVFTMYIDGAEVIAPTTMTNPHTSHNFNLHIGRYTASATFFWDGSIDQVRIFDSALDATAVEKLYNEKPEVNTSNFETVLYEGNGGSQYVSNVGFEPDLVWIKSRGINYDHQLHDSVRGAGNGLLSNSTVASVFYNTVTSFDSNGFFVNAPGTYVGTNANNQDFVAWCWKAGGDAVLNEQGTIDSQVSANTAAGFSIVKYTGSGSQPQTVGHGLSSAPEMIIYKNLNTTFNWHVYHESVMNAGDAKFLRLNTNDALLTDGQADVWTSGFSATTFGIGDANNASGNDHLAYCFHSVAGYQKVGSYVGNNPTSSTVRDITGLGFTPRFVLLKNASTLGPSWNMYDSVRPNGFTLLANSPNAEANYSGLFEIITDGFRLKSINTNTNHSTDTFIYLAIA